MDLSTVLDYIAESVCCLDSRGQIAFANRSFAAMLGWSREEINGKTLQALAYQYRPDGASILADQCPLSWLDEGIFVDSIEETLWRRDGQPVLVELSIFPVGPEESLHVRTLVAMQDVADRKLSQEAWLVAFRELADINNRLEEVHLQLLQSEKLASVGQLAAGMAHEINNPIGFIYSNLASFERYVSLMFSLIDEFNAFSGPPEALPGLLARLDELKRQIDYDFLREDLLALLSESRDGLLRVKKIVQDLRVFARDDTQPGQWGWADLNRSLEAAQSVLTDRLSERMVHCHYGALPQIYCVVSELSQVWMNVLLNALQAVDIQGDITISTGAEGGVVWIEFVDTGCGMPPDVITHIFDPFFTTRPVGAGMGLGLSIADRIVRKHGGRILVESEQGKGTNLRIILPINGPDALVAQGGE